MRSCAKRAPDTGRRHHLLPLHHKRNAQSLLNPLGYSNGIAAISDFLQQYDEFISPESCQAYKSACVLGSTRTRNHINPSNTSDQSAGNLFQQPVPCRVAQAVVENLEFIEINEQYSEFIVCVPLGQGQRVSHPIQKQSAIGQVGQSVMQRMVSERLFRLPALRDITIHDD